MGYFVSIPKHGIVWIKTDTYDLTGCYNRHYYCRSKKRFICVPNSIFEPNVQIKPILVDGKYVYRIWKYWDWSFYIDRDKLIDVLKTQLKGESIFVDIDDFEDVDQEKYTE